MAKRVSNKAKTNEKPSANQPGTESVAQKAKTVEDRRVNSGDAAKASVTTGEAAARMVGSVG